MRVTDQKSAYAALSLVSLAIGVLFFRNSNHCCDTQQYLSLAESFSIFEFWAFSDEMRTIGYLLFIRLFSLKWYLPEPSLISLYLAQASFYLFAAFVFCHTIERLFNEKIGTITFAFLSLNPAFIALNFVPLADSFYISLSILSVALSFLALHSRSFFLLCVAGVLTGLAIIVRPIAVWLILPFLLSAVILVSKTMSFSSISKLIIVLAGFGFFPAVQSLIHWNVFGQLTPFPVFGLGESQIKWGIENYKYATFLSPNGWVGNNYPTNFLAAEADDALVGISWYFQNPLQAAQLLVLKFASAIHWDFIVPYPDARNTWTSVLGIIPMFLVILGMCEALIRLLGQRSVNVTLVLYAVWVVSCLALIMVSAVELRFVVPFFILITPFYVMALQRLANAPFQMLKDVKFAAAILTTLTLFASAMYVQSLAAY